MKKDDILSVAKQLVVYANKNNYDDLSELVSRRLISFSNLKLISGINNYAETMKLIEMFDELKEFNSYRSRPFFWLQYAIASMDCKLFDRAEQYLDIALNKCEEIDKKKYFGDEFDTFQLDTQRGRLLLEKIIETEYEGSIKQSLKNAMSLFEKSLNSKLQTKSYVLKQFDLFEKIWKKHGNMMQGEDIKTLLQVVRKAIEITDKSDKYSLNLLKLERSILYSSAR